jgi:hypothetical protein
MNNGELINATENNLDFLPNTVTGVFILCIVTKFLIYKTNICTSNIHNNTISCLLLHVLAELRHLGVLTILVYRLPEDDGVLPKHVGVNKRLYFILFSPCIFYNSQITHQRNALYFHFIFFIFQPLHMFQPL